MVPSISEVVRQFKQNWTSQLEPQAIENACREAGLKWRDRLLNPIMTVQLFFLQVLNGNTACNHLRHLARMAFTGTAYCQARMRVNLEVFQTLLSRVASVLGQGTLDTGLWLGHRVFLVDGSSFSMPDTPALRQHFGQPSGQKEGCGFPVAHWLAMMHAGTGMLTKMLTAPLRAHDMSGVTELHPELHAGDILVGDRAFCSFVHFALLFKRGVNGLMRIHQRQIVDFTPHRKHAVPGKGKTAYQKGMPRSRWLKQLRATDQIVQWHKPTTCPTWLDPIQFAALPDTLILRELRYQLSENGFRPTQITLVTTLLDAEVYSFEAVAELYGQRWRIETNFGHIKTTMKMDVLKCKTVEGVLKELTVFALIYNLVRQVMVEAARRQGVDVERISFIDALRWLMHARPDDVLGKLVVNPHRPYRIEPRVRKRRPKQYPLMNQPREVLRNELLS
jgi:hypothetical protein